MKINKKILLIDDEPDLHNIVKYNLNASGFQMESAYSAEEALNMNLNDFSLILLDIMMDGLDGMELLHILKTDPEKRKIPVMLLTAKNDEMDKIIGLETGADDYITKPFSPRELVARIKAVLRRYRENSENFMTKNNSSEKTVIQNRGETQKEKTEEFALDNETKSLIIEGENIPLTRKEYMFLAILTKSMGKVFSREELLTLIWEDSREKDPRLVDALVRRVRKKLGNYRTYLKTHSGFGYSFSYK